MAKIPLFQRGQSFWRPSTDWMRPTLNREHNLLYSKSINVNVNTIQKTPSQEHVGCLTMYLGTVWPSQVDTQKQPPLQATYHELSP